MNPLKVYVALGTRPEAIKLAPVIHALDREPNVNQRVVATGQHRLLLDQVLDLFHIKPARDLRVMQANQHLGGLTARILSEVEEDLLAFQPDWVIVQGDTTTALAVAMAAYYQRIPIAHVEAGLRTRDRFNPFPEEINRRFVDQLSDLLFAPTEQARQNLLNEGIASTTIHVTGNTGIDALLEIAGRNGHGDQGCAQATGERILLVTAHRRESFGEDLLSVCEALRELVARNPDVRVIYSVHPNPNVTIPVRRELGDLPRFELTPPLEYAEFVHLMKRSFLILTDSGGIQEEAPSLGKPVLVLRAHTERVEAIEAGTAKLVGTDPHQIITEAERLLREPELYKHMTQIRNPYGDGHAAERIVRILAKTSLPERQGNRRDASAVFRS
jgi:UDP-N-acetylglucosamine 2-epimerase (non-hydrolysing)